MKYILKVGLLALMVFVLAACGGDDGNSTIGESDTPNETTDNSAGATGFTATITGAVETELSGRGYFMCDDEVSELIIGATGSLSNNILILLPRDASAGSSYEIVTDIMSSEQTSASYIGETIENDYYDSETIGSVTLEAVPTAEGERVAGNFEFTSNNRADETVTVTGSFDFNAGENSFFNCGG